MASQSTTSNYASKIDITYPVAGKDNDSQGFRDNFTRIQNALYSADQDIQKLFLNSVLSNTSTNFHDNKIIQAVFQNCSELIADNTNVSQVGTVSIDYSQGSYQKFQLAEGTTYFNVTNWPASGNVGSILLSCSPDTVGTSIVQFQPAINTVGEHTVLPETLQGTVFYHVWTDDGGTNVYINKIGNSNVSLATATNISATHSLTIDTNVYTTGSNYITTVSANGKYGTLALLPNQITESLTTIASNQPSNTTQFQLVQNRGVRSGATMYLATTSTQFTVTTVNGATITATPAADTAYLPSLPTPVTFTNIEFNNQPVLATYAPAPVTSLTGSVTDRKGQIYANTNKLYVAFDSYTGTAQNWFRVSADEVVRQLPAGTSATTVSSLNSSTVLATTEFVQNVVNVAVTGGINGALPIGVITLWYGSIANIPDGWALCDGSTVNGHITPDLQNRFVIGASDDLGNTATTTITGINTVTGGQTDTELVTHGHAAGSVVTDPGHNHTGATYKYLLKPPYGGSLTGYDTQGSGSEQAVGGGDGGLMIDSTTGITVTTTLTNSGTTTGVNKNLPPYYALAYIMKVV